MIDLIKLKMCSFDDADISRIVEVNRLQTNSKADVLYYDNERNKNINHGFYLRINTGKQRSIRVECSLHKFWNFQRIGKQSNHDTFTISNCNQAIDLLSQKTGIDIRGMQVLYYEIGLNLPVSNDCLEYMNRMRSIGVLDAQKPFYVNPKYKDRRVIITEFYNLIKKVYKVYDKGFEMRDKRQVNAPPPDVHILRIETIRKRVEGITVGELLSPEYMGKILNGFISDWRTVQFETVCEVPKGTHKWKADICAELLKSNPETVLKQAKIKYAQKGISEKQYRSIREFIRDDWDTFKKGIKVHQSPEEMEFRRLLDLAVNDAKY